MPPCRSSPWCECGTRYDGRRIIFCDKHAPRDVIETQLASEIYVDGHRWTLDESMETERTETQHAENDLAQRIQHTTPSTGEIDESTENPVLDTMHVDQDSELTSHGDLDNAEMDSDLVPDPAIISPEFDKEDFEEHYDTNPDEHEHTLEIYYTPPNSPTQDIQFFGNETTHENIEEFLGEIPRNMLTSVELNSTRNITGIQWVPPPSPMRGHLMINQSTGN